MYILQGTLKRSNRWPTRWTRSENRSSNSSNAEFASGAAWFAETVPSKAKFQRCRPGRANELEICEPREMRFGFGNPQTGGDRHRHPLQQTNLPPRWPLLEPYPYRQWHEVQNPVRLINHRTTHARQTQCIRRKENAIWETPSICHVLFVELFVFQ